MAEAVTFKVDDARELLAAPALLPSQLNYSGIQWKMLAISVSAVAASAMTTMEKLLIAPAMPLLPKHVVLCRLRLRLKAPPMDASQASAREPAGKTQTQDSHRLPVMSGVRRYAYLESNGSGYDVDEFREYAWEYDC